LTSEASSVWLLDTRRRLPKIGFGGGERHSGYDEKQNRQFIFAADYPFRIA
jgi:hypothetical protein